MPMRPLTVHLPDDVYERAEQRAANRGTTLPGEVAELVTRFSEGNGEGAANRRGETVPQSASNAGVDDVLQELAAVAHECGSPNWDGQGAKAVSPDTLSTARRLLAALPQDVALPSVGVEPDGHLTLEWYRTPTWTLSVSVSPESHLYYAALFDANDLRGREVFGGNAPEIILSLIQRVSSG